MSRLALASFAILACIPFTSLRFAEAQTGLPVVQQPKIFVESFVIAGTQSVDSAEIAKITGAIAGSRFDDDSDELKERIQAQFRDRGYFTAEVNELDIKVIDPLASPKAIRLEAQVTEGPRCKLSVVEFTGNHAILSKLLRAKFPFKAGDNFTRPKVLTGLVSIQKAYGSLGFLDIVLVPSTKLDSANTVKLSIDVDEGTQYRMGKLDVLAEADVADRLRTRWELQSGSIFNRNYVDRFVSENQSALPADFTAANGVNLLRDCRDGTVSVHLHLVRDAKHEAADREKNEDCSAETKKDPVL